MKTVVFDIDGTLSDPSHRRHFVEKKPKDFQSFFAAMSDDPPKKEIVNLCRMYKSSGWYVIIFTGRPQSYKDLTLQWLKKYQIPFDEIYMRPSGKEFVPDDEIKQDMLNKLSLEVSVAVDDRQKVVNMWRRNGITCFQVDEGDF